MRFSKGITITEETLKDHIKEYFNWGAAWTPPEVEAMAQGGVRDEINVGSLWKDKSK